MFLIVHGLQKFKKLRQEDDFSFGADEGSGSPAAQFTEILTEGAPVGIHIIAT